MGLLVFSEVFRSDECGKAEDEKDMKPDKEDEFVSSFPFMDFLLELGLLICLLNYLGLAVIHMEIG
jgi:hypothetical protein